jgi:hypothetical protein
VRLSADRESELARETVDWILVDSARLSEIESFIERQPLGEEENAALWLWAWVEQSLAAR